jgi:hypothetical protein
MVVCNIITQRRRAIIFYGKLKMFCVYDSDSQPGVRLPPAVRTTDIQGFAKKCNNYV